MATLPVTAYVAGGALFAGLVGRHQRAWGRRRAFQLGLRRRDRDRPRSARGRRCSTQFWLLVAGATLAGYYNANAGLYRFAATEIVAPEFKERAISWVLAGGIIGAVAGPNLARVDAQPAAGRVRRRLRRARRRRAVLAGDDLVDPLPAAGRADAPPRRAGRCARS